jgi:hypothetical protein
VHIPVIIAFLHRDERPNVRTVAGEEVPSFRRCGLREALHTKGELIIVGGDEKGYQFGG